MDFNRVQQPRPAAATNVNNGDFVSQSNKKHDRMAQFSGGSKWFRWSAVLLLFLITVILVALASAFAWGNNGAPTKYLNKNEYQAVFVNVNGTSGGQVYFGHIKEITSQYIDLTNVFYIQNQSSSSSSSSSNNNSYTLVKLGCELHGPEDQMTINSDQVYFWENLKSSGQVTQKINQFYKQNPNGQNCSQSSSSSSTTQSNSTTQSSTSTTPSSSSSTKATTKP
jgi:hypothetical protein